MIAEIRVEQINVSDDQYKLVEIVVASGDRVTSGDYLLSYESSKASFEIDAKVTGFVYLNPHIEIGEFYRVNYKIAVISNNPLSFRELQAIFPDSEKNSDKNIGKQKITKNAEKLMKRYEISGAIFANEKFVTEEHVNKYLQKQNDIVLNSDSSELDLKLEELVNTLNHARGKMRSEIKRHIPTGTVLNDRWRLAESFNWGQGSSVYDETLILGNVQVGKNCWIGPFTILDGAALPIMIGDWTSIGAGTQIYTHHTIDQALSGGKLPSQTSKVIIGKCCFIAPQVIIAPGTVINDFCFVTAQSYVEGIFPSNSIIAGNPAKVIGKIEICEKTIKKIIY